ncbi:HDIG domain-containing metalloprotein [uncultured Clostridium sp.]|uniref:HD family phosphohydrolase n=1 Tax=uncultured Clostridium sp. TaxID=59620 RepID=UPI002628A4C0|nr:HDIG domain-containing metalloprotein [uncultured Clostridium sp.]
MYIISFIIIYGILITAIAPKEYDLKVGDIARVTIKAPRDTIDQIATKRNQEVAAKNVDKQYTLKSEVESQVEESITNILNKVIDVEQNVPKESDQLKELLSLPNTGLNSNNFQTLLNLSQNEIKDLEFNVQSVIKSAYANNIAEDNPASLNNAIDIVEDQVNALNQSIAVKNVLKQMIIPKIQPNFFYDKVKTEEAIQEAEKAVPKVVIKKNQTIVTEGEPVTAEQIAILKDLGLIDQSGGASVIILYGVLALFTALILFIKHLYIYKSHRNVFNNSKMLIMINTISILSFILARIVYVISPYAIPLACAPILITLLVDYRVSIVVASLDVIVIGAIVNFNPQVMMLGILSTIIGATSLRKMQQRNDILYSSIGLIIMSAILTFSTGFLLSNNLSEILILSLAAAGGVVFSAILAIGVLPFFESGFDIVTNLKLLELSNPNNPLLKKLLMEAPGTYHHSMLVANLAEMAAEDIQANPVVARVGAYYHDVGKTVRPYFFKENQIGKENPHDKINPNLSTLIILSHVKDGLELAKEYKLPEIIQDMIVQHHGTTLVKYFYYTMKNSAENPDDVKEEDFRYPGPIPNSKEAGILMLADSVEAAVRSISEPSKGKIEEMVNNIIKDKLYSGQLDNCDLTLKDLEKIRKSFLKALNGIYHQRIEYPTEKVKTLK